MQDSAAAHHTSNVLITGGAGFIGSHLTDALLAQGRQVVVLDDMSTGQIENLGHLTSNPGLKMVHGSVLDTDALAPLVEQADVIFHLAAAVGVQFVVENLLSTLETNTEGTRNVLSLANDHGVQKVVVASTSEVYGKNRSIPHREDDDMAIGPASVGRWGYACSKMLDEFLTLAYHKEQGLPAVVVRLFNTAGPRQTGRYGMVIPRFVNAALKNEPITIHGDGNQTRCFTHVSDVVGALTKIIDCPEAVGQIFNLGSEQRVSINELASVIKETLGSESPVVHVPYTEVFGSDFEDIPERVPDISKIKRTIGYQPQRVLSEIIQDVADHITGTAPTN